MKFNCPHCGKEVMVNNLGRKKGNYPVQIVLDAYREYSSVRAVSRKLNLSPGTVSRILKSNGALL